MAQNSPSPETAAVDPEKAYKIKRDAEIAAMSLEDALRAYKKSSHHHYNSTCEEFYAGSDEDKDRRWSDHISLWQHCCAKIKELCADFHALLPAGQEGDELIRRLVDMMTSSVQMGMEEEAILLLEQQIACRAEGLERAKIGARLALLYLLQRQPQEAREALLKTEEPNLPVSLHNQFLQNQRLQLMACALSGLGRPQEGLSLLERDQSRMAELLRVELCWQARNWQAAADLLENLSPPPSETLKLAEPQVRMILDRATALTLAQNATAVAALRGAFLPAMMNTAGGEEFDRLTAPTESGLIEYATIGERIKHVKPFQKFLQIYRDALVSNRLSSLNGTLTDAFPGFDVFSAAVHAPDA